MQALVNIGIILTYIMIIAGAIAALYFGVMKLISNTENAKKTIYTIGGLFIVFIFSYLIASNEVLPSFEKYNITPAVAKQVGMGLNVFYLLGLAGIGAIIFAEFSKAFKK